MSVRIGCDNLVYALMTTEDTVAAAPIYATPVRVPGVISINVNPNASQETLFADDGPYEAAVTMGAVDVEINQAYLTAQDKATLLGHTVDSQGGITFSADDVPPYVAIGFRSLKSNGKYRYVWLYKGRFVSPEESNETKGDGINFQTDTISGQFVKLVYAFTIGAGANARKKRPWKYEIDEDTPGAPANLATTWFTAVKMPNTTLPTSP